MTTKVNLPQLGESVVEATVGRWKVREGQRVEKDQPLVEILTDKADTEINAPVAGVVTKLHKQKDEAVAVGEVLCEIDEAAEATAGDGNGSRRSAEPPAREPKAAAPPPRPAAPAAEERSAREPAASPAVRRAAREAGLPLQEIEGTGDRGRITIADVRRAERGERSEREERSERPTAPDPRPAVSPPPPPPAAEPEAPAPRPAEARRGTFRLPPYVPQEGDEIVPFTRRRRIIADHMVYSKQVAPQVVTFAECDLDATSRVRDEWKDRYKKEGVNLTFLAFVADAVCRALRQFPELNSRVLDDAFVKLRDIHLGIAVDTDDGLVVPVIRNADSLTVKGLARAIADVAVRARDGKLAPDDLAGKTFTISNPGREGNLVGGAILSQPNVGIIRLGTIKKRVVVIEKDGGDLMAIHPVMYMALTYDHRIVDGVKANGFLYRVSEILERGEFEL